MVIAFNTLVSAILIALIALVAKRHPGIGGLIASFPLISIFGMILLWREKPDTANTANYVESMFWFILPSWPMFMVIPIMLRRGVAFWPSLATGCVLTLVLYSLMAWFGPKLGLKL